MTTVTLQIIPEKKSFFAVEERARDESVLLWGDVIQTGTKDDLYLQDFHRLSREVYYPETDTFYVKVDSQNKVTVQTTQPGNGTCYIEVTLLHLVSDLTKYQFIGKRYAFRFNKGDGGILRGGYVSSYANLGDFDSVDGTLPVYVEVLF